MMKLNEKQAIVLKISNIAKYAMSAVIADFRGVSATNITALRKMGRENDIYMRVIRNNLIYRAIKQTNFKCLRDIITGPTLVAFSKEHPGIAVRLFKEFAKDNIGFRIKAAVFKGKTITPSQIDLLAALPTYKEAVTRLMSIMKEASIGKLIRALIALQNQK